MIGAQLEFRFPPDPPPASYCHCIQSALAGALPEPTLPNRRVCRRCAPYACNTLRHPVNMPRALYARLRKAPYHRIAGASSMRYARKLAHEEAVRRLRAGWELEDAGKVAVPRVGHCARCSRYLPLRRNGRCDRCGP